MSFYSSEELISSVKRRITIPTNQNTYTDEEILAFADEELGLAIVPAIMSLHEDYLLFSQDVPMVNDQTEYMIPYRAVGNKLYDLQYADSEGPNASVIEMSRTTLGDEPNHNGSYTSSYGYSYAISNNKVKLLTSTGGIANGFLRFIYYIRPSKLVFTEQVGVITNINSITGEITVSSLPTDFGTDVLYDFYKAKSPHSILSIDISAISVNVPGKTITIDPEDIPLFLEVGDHIAKSQQCAIPQIPSDLHVFLAQKTAERILEAQGDLEGLRLAQVKSAEMEIRAGTIIDNRVEESPLKVLNRRGILRSGLFGRFRRGY